MAKQQANFSPNPRHSCEDGPDLKPQRHISLGVGGLSLGLGTQRKGRSSHPQLKGGAQKENSKP